MTKRKPPSKKRSTLSKKKQTTSNINRFVTRFLIGLIGFIILCFLLATAAWIGYDTGKKETSKRYEKQVYHYRQDLQNLKNNMESIKRSIPVTNAKPKIKTKQQLPSEIQDYTQATNGLPSKPPVKKNIKVKRPKLAIVLDDVSFAYQIKAIRALPWHITPSFFPPTKRHPDTPKFAAHQKHFMIHLPMQAVHYAHPEPQTLTIESTDAQITQRLKDVRHWFPKARFMNNHTGSEFTANLPAMERFYPLALKYGFIFIDSRTTSKTVVPRVCKMYHMPYVGRDIFLDDKANVSYILGQLKQAVDFAKKHGYAIAIGHPRPATLKALREAKNVLKGVDTVYIDQLYAKIR